MSSFNLVIDVIDSIEDRTVLEDFLVGITTPKEILVDRIAKRTAGLLSNGIIDESEFLASRFGWENESMKANIYPLVKRYIEHDITEKELLDLNNTADWQLAKRQMTWFNRDKFIIWQGLDDAFRYLCSELATVDVT
jgi:tRNA A37 N6-isopentenylltransferase MiaA